MRKLIPFTLVALLAICFSSFTFIKPDPPVAKNVKWYTWEEAMEANKTEKKKIFVDLYTDWCGWCKKMDKNTFENAKVAAYLNEHFYPVKFDAEQKEDIIFNGHTFKFVQSGRRGVHTLAYSLTDGKMSYPTVVFLTEKMERVAVSPGYKDAKQFMKELKYTAEEHYKNTSWNDYVSGRVKP